MVLLIYNPVGNHDILFCLLDDALVFMLLLTGYVEDGVSQYYCYMGFGLFGCYIDGMSLAIQGCIVH